jgi:hypothetical protein
MTSLMKTIRISFNVVIIITTANHVSFDIDASYQIFNESPIFFLLNA